MILNRDSGQASLVAVKLRSSSDISRVGYMCVAVSLARSLLPEVHANFLPARNGVEIRSSAVEG